MADEWDLTRPVDSTLISNLPDEHRKGRTNVATVVEREHEDLGDGNSGAQHRLGSAVANEGSTTPTKTVDITSGTVALDDIARDRGRLWVDDNYDPPVLKRWDGSAWEVLGRVIVDAESAVLTFINEKSEDTDGGRESQIRAKGTQSGDEETTLGYIEFSHEGSGNDQKGQLRIFLNDEDDDNAPTLVMTIPSTGVPPTMVETTAPAADGQLANKKYVDDTYLTGQSVQVVNTQTGAVNTGTTVIPYDDSIPQKTDGDEYMTLAITPTNASNKLKIEVVVALASSVATGETITAALFQDDTTDAIAAINMESRAIVPNFLIFTHYMTAGTTSETTFKVRGGLGQAGTTTFNGLTGSRKMGGVMASSITITEIKV